MELPVAQAGGAGPAPGSRGRGASGAPAASFQRTINLPGGRATLQVVSADVTAPVMLGPFGAGGLGEAGAGTLQTAMMQHLVESLVQLQGGAGLGPLAG